MKKLLLIAALMSSGFAHAQSAVNVMQCDPNATGNTQYPNVVCDSTGHLLVTASTGSGNAGTLTSHSGSVTTGGTSQNIITADANRKYLFVQNTSSANEYIAFGVAANVSGGILLLPNSSYVMESTYVSVQIIALFGATTGQTFSAWTGD